jgi:hypothetical protein
MGRRSGFTFHGVPYPSGNAMFAALDAGEVDAVAQTNFYRHAGRTCNPCQDQSQPHLHRHQQGDAGAENGAGPAPWRSCSATTPALTPTCLNTTSAAPWRSPRAIPSRRRTTWRRRRW